MSTIVRASRPRRWSDIDPTRHGVVLSWLSFTVTFIIARIVTGVIKLADSSTGDVQASGVHLHHYLWGMILITGTAVYGLVDRGERARRAMGIALGVGLALVVDEIALLITLRDVYWHSAGWVSVGVCIMVIGVLGTALAVTRSGHPTDHGCPDSRLQSRRADRMAGKGEMYKRADDKWAFRVKASNGSR